MISTFLSAGIVIGIALTAAVSGLSAEQTQLGGLEVIDGDTLLVSGRTREIDGIDAPELGQICLNVGDRMNAGYTQLMPFARSWRSNPSSAVPPERIRLGWNARLASSTWRRLYCGTGSPSPGAGPDQATGRRRPKPALPGLASGAAGSSIPPIGAPGHG